MESETLEKLKFPIGRYQPPKDLTNAHINDWIETIERFPEKLNRLVQNISSADAKKTYRPGGWTVQQVINHLPDSHMNSYIRFKWTLTEQGPLIKGYFEDRWAELPDGKEGPIELSVQLIEALHAKWVHLLRTLSDDQKNLYFIHPENDQRVSLKHAIGLYAWHCDHHYAHIKNALKN